MDEVRKNKVVLQYIDAITDAVNSAQDEQDISLRTISLKGILYYWMGIMFDEGRVSAANLEVANDALEGINKRLKAQNKDLLKRINKDR